MCVRMAAYCDRAFKRRLSRLSNKSAISILLMQGPLTGEPAGAFNGCKWAQSGHCVRTSRRGTGCQAISRPVDKLAPSGSPDATLPRTSTSLAGANDGRLVVPAKLRSHVSEMTKHVTVISARPIGLAWHMRAACLNLVETAQQAGARASGA